MSEITEKLPVLPLSAGVVLPHMNVTIQLDSAEAKAAVAAANLAETRQVVLLPKVGGRYAAVGTVAKLDATARSSARSRPTSPAPSMPSSAPSSTRPHRVTGRGS
jgi:hypothetical protein